MTNPKENRFTKKIMEVYNKINNKYVTTTCGLVDVTSQNSKSLDSSIHELCSMWTPVHNLKNPLEDSSQQLVYELILVINFNGSPEVWISSLESLVEALRKLRWP